MSSPTIQDFFGANASQSGGVLTVDLSAFSAEQFDAIDPSASRIAAALIKRWRNFSVGKEDNPAVGVIVSDPFVTLSTRGESVQRAFQYSATVFIPDAGASEPDPDDVV